jgi:hypothetical protein
VKLAGFAVVLVAAFGLAFGVGRAVGPVGDDASPSPSAPPTTAVVATTTSGHGGHS